MGVTTYLKQLSSVDEDEKLNFVESINIKNYGSNELSETEMWILRTAAENVDYLEDKLKEADELSLDDEAPIENETEELTLDAPAEGGEELTLDDPAEGGEELTLDEPAEGGEELTLDEPAEGGEELTLDAPEDDGEEKQEIETSLAGVGILPLLAEIQEKLANGKPSEVELAALKAMKKLF